jgi:hypothetical protein
MEIIMKILVIIAAMLLSHNAYAAGDAVGGQMDFDTSLGVARKTGLLRSIKVADHSQTYTSLEIICFDQDFTELSDNAASTYSVADVSHISFVVSVAASDYLDMGSSNFADIININKVVKSTDEKLRCQLKTISNPTFNDVNELTVCIEIQKDSQ